MKKVIIIALIVVTLGAIFLSISMLSQNEDFEGKVEPEEEKEEEPQGRNFSVELDEKMGFSAP